MNPNPPQLGKDAAVAALQVIIEAIRRSAGSHTGQSVRLVRFLAGLYNGPRFPFDMTELRALDTALSTACLTVLAEDIKARSEIQEWGVMSGRELNDWLHDVGLYEELEKRKAAMTLYQEKHGDRSHRTADADA